MHMSRLILLAGVLFLYACKKNSEETKAVNTPEEVSNSEMVAKVNAWLEEKKVLYKGNQSQNIDSLKKVLLLNSLTVESYKGSEKLVVVQVGEGFKSNNNAAKSPANYLVMLLSDGKITKGNVIQFVSPEGKRQLPKNTFSKIFTCQQLEVDGQFILLSIADNFVYGLKFENGRLKSVAERRNKFSEQANGKTSSCINWYLVTTYYDGYGNVVDVVYNFLFQTCDEDNSGGGGGGEGGNIDYAYDTRRGGFWNVYTTPNGKNTVWSNEWLNGRRAGDSSVFTSITHDWADVNNTVPEWDRDYAYYHADGSWTRSIAPNKKTGTTSIGGYLTYFSQPDKDVPPATRTCTAKTDL